MGYINSQLPISLYQAIFSGFPSPEINWQLLTIDYSCTPLFDANSSHCLWFKISCSFHTYHRGCGLVSATLLPSHVSSASTSRLGAQITCIHCVHRNSRRIGYNKSLRLAIKLPKGFPREGRQLTRSCVSFVHDSALAQLRARLNCCCSSRAVDDFRYTISDYIECCEFGSWSGECDWI